MATIEQGIRDEARISSGRVWVAPDGASNQQVVAMANAVSSLKGGKQVVSESTVGGFGQSANAPRADWKPEQVGQAHAQGNALMRGGMEASLSVAYGVPASYFNPNATAPGQDKGGQ